MTEKQWAADKSLLEFLEKAIRKSKNPDEELIGTSERNYTLKDIQNEVKNGTSFGRKYQENWLALEKKSKEKF